MLRFNVGYYLWIVLFLLITSCARPLFVTHLTSKGVALTKKKGQFMPSHKFINRFMCFDEKCLNKAAWVKKQRKQRFKGYKDGGKTPVSRPKPDIPPDTVLIAKKETTKPLNAVAHTEEQLVSVVAPAADSVVVLDDVSFAVNSYQLRAPLIPKLDSLVSFLKKSLRHEVSISGHTDNTGHESHNLRLSEHRAEAVARYLADKGIDIARITFNGFGSARSIAPNDTPENRSRNRRVEIILHEMR